jgi:DNA-binding transcriptional regulator LsrR (DeoR family)
LTVSKSASFGITGRGRPRELTLHQAVKAVVMYFRTNITQELIAELLFVDQSTISRAISDLEEINQ